MTKPKANGFTLIEILVVSSLAIILMLAASALFMTFMISNTKINIDQKIKNEGNYALRQIEYLLRNSQEITSTCPGTQNDISFTDLDGQTTTIKADSGKIASESSSTVYLTSDYSVLVDDPQFACYLGTNDTQYIEVSFSLKNRGGGSESSSDTSVQDFNTGITVRN
ncbi:MAG: hypothetical protein GF390_03230 [Candidatus Pacebacteria bacterium]|nr:hypothetical protein [Candidatus Paceibacterota bacterium]